MSLVEVAHPGQSGVEVVQLEEVLHNVGAVLQHCKRDGREASLHRRGDDTVLITDIEEITYCSSVLSNEDWFGGKYMHPTI